MRVFIAEDHPICVLSLEIALKQIDPAIHVSKADTLAAALEALSLESFDLVIADPGLRDSEGALTIVALHNANPKVPLLAISANDSAEFVSRLREAGATGFLSKGASIERMIDGIKAAVGGAALFDAKPATETRVLAQLLSPAQLRVVLELAGGHSNKEIGYRLGIAEPTVKSHVSAILRAIGASNRSQAMLMLRDGKLVGKNSTEL
ncbi:MAG: response regulator [Novosphingobium sp.]